MRGSKVYKFYHTDTLGIEEWDIDGKDYVDLLKLCFKYSKKMSLVYWNKRNSLMEERLKPYEIDFISTAKTYYDGAYVKCYVVCDDLFNEMLEISDSLFKWIYGWGYTNPEDPTFYRDDDSVFFLSVIHDGECYLMPRVNEDVTAVVLKPHWHCTS